MTEPTPSPVATRSGKPIAPPSAGMTVIEVVAELVQLVRERAKEHDAESKEPQHSESAFWHRCNRNEASKIADLIERRAGEILAGRPTETKP